jgi:hypothetical protein
MFHRVIATLNKNSAVLLTVTADGYKLKIDSMSVNPEEELKGLTEISTERFDKVHAMVREHILEASHKAGLLT